MKNERSRKRIASDNEKNFGWKIERKCDCNCIAYIMLASNQIRIKETKTSSLYYRYLYSTIILRITSNVVEFASNLYRGASFDWLEYLPNSERFFSKHQMIGKFPTFRGMIFKLPSRPFGPASEAMCVRHIILFWWGNQCQKCCIKTNNHIKISSKVNQTA